MKSNSFPFHIASRILPHKHCITILSSSYTETANAQLLSSLHSAPYSHFFNRKTAFKEKLLVALYSEPTKRTLLRSDPKEQSANCSSFYRLTCTRSF